MRHLGALYNDDWARAALERPSCYRRWPLENCNSFQCLIPRAYFVSSSAPITGLRTFEWRTIATEVNITWNPTWPRTDRSVVLKNAFTVKRDQIKTSDDVYHTTVYYTALPLFFSVFFSFCFLIKHLSSARTLERYGAEKVFDLFGIQPLPNPVFNRLSRSFFVRRLYTVVWVTITLWALTNLLVYEHTINIDKDKILELINRWNGSSKWYSLIIVCFQL